MSIKEKKADRMRRKQMLKKILATGASALSLFVLLNGCGNEKKEKEEEAKRTENAAEILSHIRKSSHMTSGYIASRPSPNDKNKTGPEQADGKRKNEKPVSEK